MKVLLLLGLCLFSAAPAVAQRASVSDCRDAIVLCGPPTAFNVAASGGVGAVDDDLGTGACLTAEVRPSWFTFTAANDSTLVFDLIPDLATAGLDFAVYELPGGAGDCGGKRLLRCMASSSGPGCRGRTGLRRGETETEEKSGCTGGNNAFLKELQLVQGRTYSLLVNNYDAANPGFRIDFEGSTADFRQTPADFASRTIIAQCGTALWTFDGLDRQGSTFAWDFGPDATPRTAVGQQVQTTFAGGNGPRSVTLTLTNDCSTTVTKTISVVTQVGLFINQTVRAASCANPSGGGVDVTVSPAGGYTFTLNGVTNTTGSFDGLAAGTYTLSVSRVSGGTPCDQTAEVIITSEAAALNPTITVDNGGSACEQSEFTFAIESPRPSGTYAWTFGNNAVPATATGPGPHAVTYTGLAGAKTVMVAASDGTCTGEARREVRYEPSVVFDFTTEVTPVSCRSDTSGVIVVSPVPAGQYAYSLDGGADRSDNRFRGVAEGTYTIRLRPVGSAPECGISREVTVGNDGSVGPSFTDVATAESSCLTAGDGRVSLSLAPGTTVSLNGGPQQSTATFDTLRSGTYALRVEDAQGCARDTSVVVGANPGPSLDLGPDLTARFGDTILIIPRFGEGRNPIDSFRYGGLDSTPTLIASLGGLRFVPNRAPQVVTLTLVDEAGCVVTDEVTVSIRVQEFFQAPTAFSPNDDGVNDRFVLYAGPQVRRVQQLSVYDRWGGLLYNLNDFPPNDPDFGWDGRRDGEALDTGVYVYAARVEFVNGTVKNFAGDVNLIR